MAILRVSMRYDEDVVTERIYKVVNHVAVLDSSSVLHYLASVDCRKFLPVLDLDI